MKELFNLGELYVSDFLGEDDEPRGGKVEMKMMLDESTGNVRLEKSAPLDVMYGKYWYRSGINQSMKNELQRIVNSILEVKKLKENDIKSSQLGLGRSISVLLNLHYILLRSA